jgi:hypothetical protein
MEIGVILVLAALAFSLLAGSIETWLARHARRELARKASVLLHPLGQRETPPRLRPSNARRGLRYVGLFVGFLIASYAGLTVAKVLYSLLEAWF